MADKIKLSAIREQYPMYANVSDEDFVRGLWKKNYADLPLQKVTDRIDFDTQRGNPTDGMSGLGKFVAGYGSALPMLAKGIGQRVGLVSQEDADEAIRLNKPLMDSGAGMAGAVLGNIALAAPTVAIPGAATIPGAAAVGAVQGLTQPTETGESALKNAAIGGVLGGGSIVAGRAVKGAYQGGKALVEPFTQGGRERIAGRMLERFAENPQAINAASTARTATGASPTLAEATGDAGIARLQDALSSIDPQISNRIGARLTDNNSARVNALRNLTGADGARDFAEQMRNGTAKDLYDRAFSIPVELENLSAAQRGELSKVMSLPAVQDAIPQARTNAQNFNMSLDKMDGNLMGLHQVKLAMDDAIAAARNAAGNGSKSAQNKADGIEAAKKRLVTFMESMSGGAYKDARTTYAEMSKPMNQMDVAKRVLEKGTSATTDLSGEPRLMPNALAKLLQDEKGLIKNATGGKSGANALADVMEPDQLSLIRQVASETDRAGAVARAGNGPGSATAQRMASQNILRQMIGPTGLPESWAESALANTVIGKPFNLVYGGVAEPRIQQALAEAVLSAPAAQRMLRAGVAPQQVQANMLRQLLEQSVRTAPAAMAGQR